MTNDNDKLNINKTSIYIQAIIWELDCTAQTLVYQYFEYIYFLVLNIFYIILLYNVIFIFIKSLLLSSA